MFTKGDINAINKFIKDNTSAIANCDTPHAMEQIAVCFADINAKLEEV